MLFSLSLATGRKTGGRGWQGEGRWEEINCTERQKHAKPLRTNIIEKHPYFITIVLQENRKWFKNIFFFCRGNIIFLLTLTLFSEIEIKIQNTAKSSASCDTLINTGIDLTYLMVVWCVNRRLSVQSSSSLQDQSLVFSLVL